SRGEKAVRATASEYPAALLLETVTFSGSGAGVAPALAVPKLSEARSSETERTDATSTSTCTVPLVPGDGEPAHACAGDAELCGSGVPAVKSVALSFVSEQPLSARCAASVLDAAGAEPAPSK